MTNAWAVATERESGILDALPANVAVLDAAGIVRSVNASWREFARDNAMPLAAEAGLGADYLAICDRAAAEGISEAAATASGLRAILSGAREEFLLEYRCDAPTIARWFRLTARALTTDEGRGLVVLHIDISDLRRGEARALAKQQMLAERDRLLSFATALARIGGWSVELPTLRLIWSESVGEILGLPAGAQPTTEESIAFFSSPVREAIERDANGGIVRVSGALQDITERHVLRLLAARAQRMDSIGTLAAGIAHDLNNAFAPILMSIELLRDDSAGAEHRETLDIVEAMANRGSNLVRQLLSFARGVEGRRVEVQLRHLLRDIAKEMKETYPRSIQMVSQLPDRIATVLGDPTQLQQVIVNLCVNARDAMPEGGRLSLSLREVLLDRVDDALFPDAVPGPYVMVVVQDTGAGIAPKDLERIYEPFFSTKSMGAGTGLGLAMSLAIVRSHGGVVHVFSEVGKGTRFEVCLPASTATVPRDAPSGSLSSPTASNVALRGHGELILVVDDEAAVRRLLERVLVAFGYRVLLASGGAEGVEQFRVHHADVALVITDMMMPEVDGPTMIRTLRTLAPSVPVLASSGFAAPEAEAKLAVLGVTDLLPKPYTTEQLLTLVAGLVSRPGC